MSGVWYKSVFITQNPFPWHKYFHHSDPEYNCVGRSAADQSESGIIANATFIDMHANYFMLNV